MMPLKTQLLNRHELWPIYIDTPKPSTPPFSITMKLVANPCDARDSSIEIKYVYFIQAIDLKIYENKNNLFKIKVHIKINVGSRFVVQAQKIWDMSPMSPIQ